MSYQRGCSNKVEPICSAPAMKCEPYKYVISQHGVLITTLSRVLGSPVASDESTPEHENLIMLNKTTLGTVYVPWSGFSHVKILVHSSKHQRYKIRVIKPPESYWNHFVETIDLGQNLKRPGNFSERPHLKGLTEITMENVYLHKELKKELKIVQNISTNPEEYDDAIDYSSIFSKIAIGLSLLAILVLAVKNFKFYSCFIDCCADRSNHAVSG